MQLCHFSTKGATDNTTTNGHGFVPVIYFYKNRLARCIWSVGYILLTPDFSQCIPAAPQPPHTPAHFTPLHFLVSRITELRSPENDLFHGIAWGFLCCEASQGEAS